MFILYNIKLFFWMGTFIREGLPQSPHFIMFLTKLAGFYCFLALSPYETMTK